MHFYKVIQLWITACFKCPQSNRRYVIQVKITHTVHKYTFPGLCSLIFNLSLYTCIYIVSFAIFHENTLCIRENRWGGGEKSPHYRGKAAKFSPFLSSYGPLAERSLYK